MYTKNAEGIAPIDIVSVKVSNTLKSEAFKENFKHLLQKKFEKDSNGLNHFHKMSKKGVSVLLSSEYRQSENFKNAIKKQIATRNSIQENGKTFQYNVAQKSSKTRILNSPHYNVYNNHGTLVEHNVSRKFVRENYIDGLRSRTKENPITSPKSKFKGYYCEVIS